LILTKYFLFLQIAANSAGSSSASLGEPVLPSEPIVPRKPSGPTTIFAEVSTQTSLVPVTTLSVQTDHVATKSVMVQTDPVAVMPMPQSPTPPVPNSPGIFPPPAGHNVPVVFSLQAGENSPDVCSPTPRDSPAVSSSVIQAPREAIIKTLNRDLPLMWIAFEQGGGICAQMLSPAGAMCGFVQRSVCASLDGGLPRILVHAAEITNQSMLYDTVLQLPPSERVEEFAGTFLEVVRKVRLYGVCVGADDLRYRDQWK